MNDNKLIAEFMGHKLGLDGDGMGEPQCRIFEKGLGTKRIEDTYSKSWDWLMPVVEMIENFGYEFIIVESRCYVKHNTDHSIEELFHIETIGSKIDTTYKAVVEFINQYNKIK